MKDFFHKTHCDRCSALFGAHTMSKFNRDVICMDCKADERLAPGYAQASAAELAAVHSGQMNYPGVGLSNEDRAFLSQRRAKRRAASEPEPKGAYCTACGTFSTTPALGAFVEIGEWDGKRYQCEGNAEGWECQKCGHTFLAFTFTQGDFVFNAEDLDREESDAQ